MNLAFNTKYDDVSCNVGSRTNSNSWPQHHRIAGVVKSVLALGGDSMNFRMSSRLLTLHLKCYSHLQSRQSHIRTDLRAHISLSVSALKFAVYVGVLRRNWGSRPRRVGLAGAARCGARLSPTASCWGILRGQVVVYMPLQKALKFASAYDCFAIQGHLLKFDDVSLH